MSIIMETTLETTLETLSTLRREHLDQTKAKWIAKRYDYSRPLVVALNLVPSWCTWFLPELKVKPWYVVKGFLRPRFCVLVPIGLTNEVDKGGYGRNRKTMVYVEGTAEFRKFSEIARKSV